MRQGACVGLAAVLALACGASIAAPVSIELLPQVRQGGLVTVGHVARASSKDLGLLQRVLHVPVAQVRPGATLQIERHVLAARIARALRLPGTDVHWRGAGTTTVVASAKTVAPGDVVKAAGKELSKWLRRHAERAEFSVGTPPRPFSVPEGAIAMKARPLGPGAVARSRMLVWVDVSVDGRHVRTLPVPFRVAAWRRMDVAVRDLMPGEPVREAVRQQEVDVTTLRRPPPRAPVAQGGTRLRHAVPAGQPLRTADIERAPVVARGQWASLKSSAGTVAIHTRVEVLQDGWAGDRVRVRPAAPAPALLATVMGPGELELHR